MFNPIKALVAGLQKTRAVLTIPLSELFGGRRKLDAALLEAIEERLLAADLGAPLTRGYLEALEKEYRGADLDAAALRQFLKVRMLATLRALPPAPALAPPESLTVWLLVGVNGAGKTTTAGKLAKKLADAGQTGLIAACDTFRAAAVEQLKIWGERAGWPVIAAAQDSDPAAVAFDALQAARARGMRRLIVDTAGRLQNKSGLMAELEKIRRVLARNDPGRSEGQGENPPVIQSLLVLDATTGQNGLSQAREFLKAGGVDALVITKLDGTAKGGAALAIAHELNLPIAWIGVGEKLEDLLPFDAAAFVDGLWEAS